MFTLTWVVDDVTSTSNPALHNEHGFAMWISGPKGNVLFDTGGSSEVLLHNLELLGLDPGTLDAIVISHAHDDHTGGLKALLPKVRPGIPLYAHPTLFRQRYSSKGGTLLERGMSISRADVEAYVTLHLSVAPQQVLPDLWTTGAITDRSEAEGRSQYHLIHTAQGYIADPYEDDLSMVIQNNGETFLLCGCCHAGLLNTLHHVAQHWEKPITGIGGGTHLTKAKSEVLERTQAYIQALPTLNHVWLGHCSGEVFMDNLRAALPAAVFRRAMAGAKLVL